MVSRWQFKKKPKEDSEAGVKAAKGIFAIGVDKYKWVLYGAVLLVGLIYVGTRIPQYNWDMVPYIGVAQSYISADKKEIHRNTYDQIQKNLSKEQFNQIIGADQPTPNYRSLVYENKEYFSQQLPFYSVKPLYPALILALKSIGVNFVSASVWVSRISFLLCMLVILIWLDRYLRKESASLAFLLILFSQASVFFSRFSTPDSLSGFFFLLCSYLLFAAKKPVQSILLFPLLILARPDNLIIVLLFSAYIFLFHSSKRIWASGAVVTMGVQYWAQTILSGNYGWGALFYHSFYGAMVQPSAYVSQLKMMDYFNTYIAQLHTLDTKTLIWWILVALVIAFFRFRNFGLKDRNLYLSIINVIYMSAHWILFPSQNDRLLFISYLLIVLLGFITVGELLETARLNKNQMKEPVF